MMFTEDVDIERILEEQGFFVSTTVGVSMYPMLRNRRDTVVITPVSGKLKKYDVPLYRRGDDYVLHRIIGVLPDSYVILGDNCMEKEYGITDREIIGVLSGFYRDDREIDMDGLPYRLYSGVWLSLYPVRRLMRRLRGIAARIRRRFGNGRC